MAKNSVLPKCQFIKQDRYNKRISATDDVLFLYMRFEWYSFLLLKFLILNIILNSYYLASMALNYIWIGFFLVAFVVAVLRVVGFYLSDYLGFLGYNFTEEDLYVFSAIIKSTFSMAETSIDIIIYLIGVMALWLGIMKIGEEGGAVNVLAKIIGPFFHRLFPEIPRSHPANGAMMMNIAANMLGLDNAATPLGLKAMNELQSLNKSDDTASNAQIMFMVLNTSGLTLIPVSIMGLRAEAGATNPADVFIPILLATFVSSLVGLIAVAAYQKLNLFQPVIMAYLLAAIGFVGLILATAWNMPQEQLRVVTDVAGNGIIFCIIIAFIWLAFRKKVHVFEAFIEGAKDGFGVAVKIIPYLVAMLVAIGVFRASGAMELLLTLIRNFFVVINHVLVFFGLPTMDLQFVEALPVALMKPLSGSGARGLMVEAMKNYGWDSLAGSLSAILQGTTETTFYVLAVYFGAVGIKKTRYAVPAALIADLAGVIAAIFIAYIFFG